MAGCVHRILAVALVLGATAATAHDVVREAPASSKRVDARPFSPVPVLVAEPEIGAEVVIAPGSDPATKSQRADGTVIVHLNGAGMEELRVRRTSDGRLLPSCGVFADAADPVPMTDFRVARIARGDRHDSP